MTINHPHVLGIDDAPFDKWEDEEVPVVGVIMENATLVEGVAVTSFPVDGSDATGFFSQWISDLRWEPMLNAVIFGGITIAGLGVIDIHALAGQLRTPVIAVTRHDTAQHDLARALRSAGLSDRLPIIERSPPAREVEENLYVASAGADPEAVDDIVLATLNKARLPEPLRIAHLIGAAIVNGSSHGRV